MATAYIPDEFIHEIMSLGENKSKFIKEAIKEKLERVKNNGKKIL